MGRATRVAADGSVDLPGVQINKGHLFGRSLPETAVELGSKAVSAGTMCISHIRKNLPET